MFEIFICWYEITNNISNGKIFNQKFFVSKEILTFRIKTTGDTDKKMPPFRWGLTLCGSPLRQPYALHDECECDAEKSLCSFCRLIGLKSSYSHTQMLSNPVTPLFERAPE